MAELKVSQRARDAAGSATDNPVLAFNIRNGLCDSHRLVQAFAIFEQEAPAGKDETRQDIEALFNDALNDHGPSGYGRDTPAQTAFGEIVERLKQDVLAALPLAPREGWQEISTAPKDGEIVGHDALTGVSHVTYWDGCRWHDPDRHYYSEALEFNPTHWTRLPAAPAALSRTGEVSR